MDDVGDAGALANNTEVVAISCLDNKINDNIIMEIACAPLEQSCASAQELSVSESDGEDNIEQPTRPNTLQLVADDTQDNKQNNSTYAAADEGNNGDGDSTKLDGEGSDNYNEEEDNKPQSMLAEKIELKDDVTAEIIEEVVENTTVLEAKTENGGNNIAALRYEKGMRVEYINNLAGKQEECTILDVHLDDLLVPYYTIRLEDGREKQTDNAHIAPIAEDQGELEKNNEGNPQTEDESPAGDNSPPQSIDKAAEHLNRQIQFVATQTSEGTSSSSQLLDREILFDDNVTNIQAFNDDDPGKKIRQGYTNRRWNVASDKTLSFTAPVLRVSAGRYFWSADVYEKRILAIYKNPDVILVLRLPKDEDEVHSLLEGGKADFSEKKLHSFLVVESVATPLACKIRLSQLTNPTSVPTKDMTPQTNSLRSSMNSMVAKQNDINRKRSCFDLFTPTETIHLSAAFLPADCFDDMEYTNEKSLNDTHRCEDAIISALINAHLSGPFPSIHDDQTWKHQVVLGTLHSYVVSGNEASLKESLATAFEIQQSQDGSDLEKVDPSVIDIVDDSGRTALHHACNRRKSTTVQILVNSGADCSIAQEDGCQPCHIAAEGLDDQVLSVLLSSSPSRPDPNALAKGRTPMYLAAVEGKSVANINSISLQKCLSALTAWGGKLMIESPKSNELLHPVHCVSTQWRSEELSVLLSHCKMNDSSDASMSLSARFQYPLHAALISLRSRIHSAFQENSDSIFHSEYMPSEPPLVRTLRTLLEHGFEPNERLEGIVNQGDTAKSLSCFFGFTPLQVLALAALDAKAIELTKQELGQKDAVTLRVLRNIMKMIQSSAEFLLKNGARTNLPPPPSTRLDRPTPAGCFSLKEALNDPETSSLQMGNRDELILDGKKNEIVGLFGGTDRVIVAQKVFAAMDKSIVNNPSSSSTMISESTPDNSYVPGGSDSDSCAICWSEFGVISNRKHLCRVSCRYVCNDCSTKRLIVNARENRVSDGQFLLTKAEGRKFTAKVQCNQNEQIQKQRQSVTKARESLGLVSKDDANAKNTDVSTTQDRISNAISGLGQMKDKVVERGDKLNSLQDKSEALEKQSIDFANMAKELNRSQNSWW